MNREEFMKELEYLVMDIPDEDKADALAYYRDYLEEAGDEDQDKVIREFGSPERIAAIIRSDLSGGMEQGGEFTDKGYQDERFNDPNFQVANRYDLPEKTEEYREYSDENHEKKKKVSSNNRAKTVLIIILIIAASPMLLSLGGGLAGFALGILGLIIGAAVGIGAITLALILAGIGVIVGGIACMFAAPVTGAMILGIGLLVLGFGIAFLALCGAFYGKFLPFLFRTMIDWISRLFHGRRAKG